MCKNLNKIRANSFKSLHTKSRIITRSQTKAMKTIGIDYQQILELNDKEVTVTQNINSCPKYVATENNTKSSETNHIAQNTIKNLPNSEQIEKNKCQEIRECKQKIDSFNFLTHQLPHIEEPLVHTTQTIIPQEFLVEPIVSEFALLDDTAIMNPNWYCCDDKMLTTLPVKYETLDIFTEIGDREHELGFCCYDTSFFSVTD